MRTRLRLWQDALNAGETAIAHLSPLKLIGMLRERLVALDQRLTAAPAGRVRRGREAVEGLTATLQALSPLAVLARGYSICQNLSDGQVIREAQTVAPGTQVDIRLWRGRLQCTVEAVTTKGSGHG